MRNTQEIKDCSINATDGDIGHADHFYFDDESWSIRYLVADTGNWLPGRKVLISPQSIESVDWETYRLCVGLRKREIEDAPGIDADRPVARQQEIDYHRYYGLPPYWVAPGAAGAGIPYGYPEAGEESAPQEPRERRGDPRLRSTEEVTGYHIQASDGRIGHVEDFIIDDENWTIGYVVVDTRDWLPGKKVLLTPGIIERVDWPERTVYVGVDRQPVRDSPEWDEGGPVTPEYEELLYRHYSSVRGREFGGRRL